MSLEEHLEVWSSGYRSGEEAAAREYARRLTEMEATGRLPGPRERRAAPFGDGGDDPMPPVDHEAGWPS